MILKIPLYMEKFVFPSHYLLFPILDIQSPVENSSSHLIIWQFSSWKSHFLWKIRLPISLFITFLLGNPMSCGKFVFPFHYLLLPILDVPFPVVNSSSHLIICHFSSWKSHVLVCGKFVSPSPYLSLPILDVPSPVVNSSSHLIICHFLPWKSHIM